MCSRPKLRLISATIYSSEIQVSLCLVVGVLCSGNMQWSYRDWLVVGSFYVRATSKVISKWVPTYDNMHSRQLYSTDPLDDQATSTMTWYPTQSHDTESTSPCPSLIKSSARLGCSKYQFCKSKVNIYFKLWHRQKMYIYIWTWTLLLFVMFSVYLECFHFWFPCHKSGKRFLTHLQKQNNSVYAYGSL